MDEGSDRETLGRAHPRYRTAWLGGRFLAGAGWLLTLLGLAGGAAAAWLRKDVELLLIGAVSGVSGLFMVVAGQAVRATVENANQTREILRVLESGPFQWATRPPPPPVPAPPRELTREQSAWLKTPSTPISAEMRSSVSSEDVSPCVNPFCERLLPEGTKVCPHCKTRQRRASA